MKNKEAIAFIKVIQKLYLEDRDMATLFTYFDEDFTWIGAGDGEISFGMNETKQYLLLEQIECPKGFTVVSSSYNSIEAGTDVVVVFGELFAVSRDERFTDISYRFSATCNIGGERIRLRHLHLSCPTQNVDFGRFYADKSDLGTSPESQSSIKKALKELRQMDIEMANLTRNIPGASHQCLIDRYFTLVSMSDSFLTMTGYTSQEITEIFNNRFIDMIIPEDRASMVEQINEQLLSSDIIEVEYRIQRKDGSFLWVLDKGKKTAMANGVATFYCIILDITKQKEERETLRLSLERHKIIMGQTNDIIFEWDIISDCLIFSSNWTMRFGYPAIDSQVSKRIPLSENIHPEDMGKFKRIMNDMTIGIPFSETEVRIRDVLGNFIWHRIRATAQYDSLGRTIKAIGVIIDIDSEKKKTESLVSMSQKDSLTGLLNKITTQELTQDCLQNCAQGAMLILDIDDFKHVNDNYGHLCGDSILTEFASILKRHFRSTDIIGRIGGDEFLAFLPGISSTKTKELIETLLLQFSEIAIEGRKSIVSSSIGCAFFPNDGASFVELYGAADTALYYAKNRGKGTYISYEDSKDAGENPYKSSGSEVNSPIDSDEFSINEQTAQYCFRMLYSAADTKEAIKNLLEIVGRSCEASRVYIFENSDDNLMCNNTFEWCAAGVEPQMERLQGVLYREDIPGYLELYDEKGILYCTDINELGFDLVEMLEIQSIKAILHCSILDNGQFKGFIGFDDCVVNRIWTGEQVKSLAFVTEIIGTFLLKQRSKEQIRKLVEGH